MNTTNLSTGFGSFNEGVTEPESEEPYSVTKPRRKSPNGVGVLRASHARKKRKRKNGGITQTGGITGDNMDKQAILKLFKDNSTAGNSQQSRQEPTQVFNNSNVIIQNGDNATAIAGCSVDNNINLTCADKQRVHDLIHSLEQRNRASRDESV